MVRSKKPQPHLIEHAEQIAKSGAIKIPTMIKSQMHHFMDEEKSYYDLLKYLEQFDYYNEDCDPPPAFSNIAKALEITPSRLTKMCHLLYEDLQQYLGGWGEVWGYKPNEFIVPGYNVRLRLFYMEIQINYCNMINII